MKSSGRFLARHLGLVALGAIVAGALIFSGPALAGVPGTQKWAFPTGGAVGSSPAIGADGTIYVGSDDYKLYAVYSSSLGLANSPWPMFHHDVRHNGRVGYIPPQPQKNTAAISSLLLSN